MKMHKLKIHKLIPFLILSLMLTAAVGCGSTGTSSASSEQAGTAGNTYATEDTANDAVAAEDGETMDGFAEGMDTDEVSEEASPEEGTGIEDAQSDRKLIYTSDLSIDTKNYTETKRNIRALISEHEGFISVETEDNYDTYWYDERSTYNGLMNWYITVRIPPNHYEAFLNAVQNGEDCKVMSISSQVENISTVYQSKEAEIQALETEEARLLEMMAQATTIEEMIRVEERLTEVETRLNQSKTDLAYMDSMVNYSTVNLTLNEVRSYRTAAEEETTFFSRLRDTIVTSWERFLNGTEDLLFFVILHWPELLILGIILFVVLKVKKKKASMPKKPGRKERNSYSLPPVFHEQVRPRDGASSKPSSDLPSGQTQETKGNDKEGNTPQ